MNISIIGGDLRNVRLAELYCCQGDNVYVYGLENYKWQQQEEKMEKINNKIIYNKALSNTDKNKIHFTNTLDEAITNLLSQSAVNIEIDNTEDIEGMLQAIIDANNNLKESNESNDWEMIGSDIKELQSLIDSLDKMLEEQDNVFGTSTTDSTENNQQSILEF